MTIIHDDVIKWTAGEPEVLYHAALLDPPYHLQSIVKRFGAGEPDHTKTAKDVKGRRTPHARQAKGFMLQSWDGGDIAYRAETWEGIAKHLYPGAFIIAFSGSRGWHRQATAMEDAGLIMHPTIMLWAFGNGFPKSTKVKDARFEGYGYGMQALKPAVEPILCLSEDTEILTDTGWKFHHQISPTEKVMAWNPATEELKLDVIKRKIEMPITGELVNIKNRDTDQLMTLDHRVYCKPSKGRKKRYSPKWEVLRADELTYNYKIPLSGYQQGGGIGGDSYAALLAWIWTEGSFEDRRSSTGIRIYQSSVNNEHVMRIRKLLKTLVPYHSEYKSLREYKGRLYTQFTWRFARDVAQRIRSDLPNKHLSYDLLYRMTVSEKMAFLDAAVAGDGHTDKRGSQQFQQKDISDQEIFHTLLSLCGKAGTINKNHGTISIKQKGITEVRTTRRQIKKSKYTGTVWCVVTSTGAFMARRNGKVFITGNCFQKPYKGRPQDNIIRTGAGAINLNGGRIAVNPDIDDPRLGGQGSWKSDKAGRRGIYRPFGGNEIKSHPAGRLPSNLILQHLPDCVCLGTEKRRKAGGDITNPATVDRRLVYQPRKQRDQWQAHGDENGNETVEKWKCAPDCPVLDVENQSGVAARFFFKSNWQYEEDDPYLSVDAGQYIPKASTTEREAGLIGKLPCVDCGEMDSETHPDPNDPDRQLVCRRNVHPTIKAINLTRYLATLLLPPEDYAPRRLLVPFSGAGSEVIGAELAGWEDVTGIEMGEEYVNLANMRIEHWRKHVPKPYLMPDGTPIQQTLF